MHSSVVSITTVFLHLMENSAYKPKIQHMHNQYLFKAITVKY